VVPHPDGWCVEIGASRGERPHDRVGVRIVPGPIGEKMQRRAPAALGVLDYAKGEPGIGGAQPAQPLDFALLERRREHNGRRLITL
jgi:hypothetical protein